jgi:aspartyl-tRNA(Asn)/glutamyl-tRNA(Gln) amidotransferase subunit A
VTSAIGLGIEQVAHLIQSGQLSSAVYVRALLDHIERLEPLVRAWAAIDRDGALRAAELADRDLQEGRPRGPLHGIPIGIKDLLDVAGTQTRAGSPMLAGHVAAADAAVIARLRAAGAIILGKTATTVFAAMDPADTVNPWNQLHTPGGSSSGSAAAVASCMCPAALGSQTAGSVLRPASYCGVTGFKPTYDAISRQGLFVCAWSMDHVGIIARSVGDIAAVFAAVVDAPEWDASDPETQKTIGVPDRYFHEGVTPDVAQAFAAALESFRAAGASTRTVTLPASFEAGAEAGILIMYAEMAAFHRSRFAAHKEAYPFRIRTLIEAGLEIRAADYLRAQQVRRKFIEDLSGLLDEVDCLVTPATPAPAPPGLDATGDWRFNLPFSASGHPALSVPCGWSSNGLPIGLQLVAGHGREQRLLAAGRRFQAITNWHERRPAMMQEDAT